MRNWDMRSTIPQGQAHPTVVVFMASARLLAARVAGLTVIDREHGLAGEAVQAASLIEKAPGGLLLFEVPYDMSANLIAAHAREFTLAGFGVVLVAPGGSNGLHNALGHTDEELSLSGLIELAPLVMVVHDEEGFVKAIAKLQAPNATLALVKGRQ